MNPSSSQQRLSAANARISCLESSLASLQESLSAAHRRIVVLERRLEESWAHNLTLQFQVEQASLVEDVCSKEVPVVQGPKAVRWDMSACHVVLPRETESCKETSWRRVHRLEEF